MKKGMYQIAVCAALLGSIKPASALTWVASRGSDCAATCAHYGGAATLGVSPAGWGAWGSRHVFLCLSEWGGGRLFGSNFGARAESSVDASVCTFAAGGGEVKSSSFSCACNQ